MNTPLPPQEPEKLPGEVELAALYRKLPQAEPGPALDQAVLRAAAKALADDAERATATHAVRRPRWPVALGSAAALVLVAGLAWHMRELPEATAPAAQAPADMAERSAQAPTAPAVPPPPPAPPAPAMAEPAPARQAVAARASQPPARKAFAQPEAKPQIRQQVAVPMPAPMPAPPAVIETTTPAPALVAPLPAPPAPPAPPAATAANFAAENPAAELEVIRHLFAQGNDKEGSERLTRFRKAHPDIALPDDLRTHLPQP
ncbi:hypothetical protein ACFWZ3_05120 [Frateuria sp. GZRR35]|uniref:hypothetical protein n=1 Tax=Frateuria sp. GZRR35 TaxID=3351536 RepID=UPI003EDC3FA9